MAIKFETQCIEKQFSSLGKESSFIIGYSIKRVLKEFLDILSQNDKV